MARRKAPAAKSRIVELFATSEERVDQARRRFESAQTSLTNARAYGTEVHAIAAAQALMNVAESYADALRTHTHLVIDYAEERARG
jgi:hypothetical protein